MLASGQAALIRGDWEEARHTYQALVDNDEDLPEPRGRMAIVARLQSDETVALQAHLCPLP